MHPLVACAVIEGLAVTAGLVTVGAAWRRGLGLAIGLSAAVVPFFAERNNVFLVFLAALCAVLPVIRSIDLARDRTGLSVGKRVWMMLAVFDVRLAEARAAGFDAHAVPPLLVSLVVALPAFLLGSYVANTQIGVVHYLLRWGGCAVFAVAVGEAVARALPLAYGVIGIRPPRLHDAPYRSASVREFWGERWNRAVGRWLRSNCYRPLARRRRATAGVAAAFATSALLHWYFVFVPLGLYWSLVFAGFFLVQGPLIAVERALGVRRWPTKAARAWTVGILLATSPLFSEPMLRLVDPLVR